MALDNTTKMSYRQVKEKRGKTGMRNIEQGMSNDEVRRPRPVFGVPCSVFRVPIF